MLITVKNGELWRAGPHVFYCGDLEDGGLDELHDMLVGRGCCWVYSDPPWSPGNARMWRTLAGQPRPVDINTFFNKFCIIVKNIAADPVFIEQGVGRQAPLLEAAVDKLPLYRGAWTVYYGRPPRPNLLLAFSNKQLPETFNPTGMRGEAMTDYVFKTLLVEGVIKHGDIVVDPCVGKGLTARIAHKYGQTCYGMDLNPDRLATTLGWLSRYYDVERVHE